MQIDPEDFKRHYALLSDDALLEVDPENLVDAARACYEAELKSRQLTRTRERRQQDQEVEAQAEPAGADAAVASFQYPDQLAGARDVLESAGLPYSIRANHSRYEIVVPAEFRAQAEQKLRSQFLDPESETDYQHHFEELADEELLALNTEGLSGAACRVLDEELYRRGLESAREDAHVGTGDGLRLAGTFVSLEDAKAAQVILSGAGIVSSLENEDAEAWSGAGEIRLMVSAPDYEQACEILEERLPEAPEP